MSVVFASLSMSLDGYIAGPNPSLKDPLGVGGMQLHQWAFKLNSWQEVHGKGSGETGPEDDLAKQTISRTGAHIMGRKMYSGGSGPWESDPNAGGWWGDTPPFHASVFVLTSHAREPLPMDGGTTFTFVTDGVESALAQAKAAAGDKDVAIAGGANAVQQFIKAGLLDELNIQLIPVLLGGGTRLLDNLDPSEWEKVSVADFPLATHLKYRIK
jgi:dihydrofolate reductase